MIKLSNWGVFSNMNSAVEETFCHLDLPFKILIKMCFWNHQKLREKMICNY